MNMSEDLIVHVMKEEVVGLHEKVISSLLKIGNVVVRPGRRLPLWEVREGARLLAAYTREDCGRYYRVGVVLGVVDDLQRERFYEAWR